MEQKKDIYSADYEGFSLVSGGLIYSITKIFRKKAKPGKELTHTAIALALITRENPS